MHGRLSSGELLMLRLAGALEPRERLAVSLPESNLHVFDAASGARLDPEPAVSAAPLLVGSGRAG